MGGEGKVQVASRGSVPRLGGAERLNQLECLMARYG